MKLTKEADNRLVADALESCDAVATMLFLGSNKMVLVKNDAGQLASLLHVERPEELSIARFESALSEIGLQPEVRFMEGVAGTGICFASAPSLELPSSLANGDYVALTLAEVYAREDLSQELLSLLPWLRRNVIRIPYLYFSENDYVYRFRTDKQRNRDIYNIDEKSVALYQSELCFAVKALKRARERSATSPAVLDFGATRFALPSHFGFCLGVQNAIERAYETLAENPGRRVFMLSELIHNPFVNEDLRERGLRYLQSDKGSPAIDPETSRPYWDDLSDADVVIIPAFGASDEDKVRLVERGIAINRYDATCMLVEKVWKAARRYGRQGYTVVIHGKAEHEETKATFSNSEKYAPSLTVRDLREAEHLAQIILAKTAEERQSLFTSFSGRYSEGFDVEKSLERLAVVNQTTLLRNETLKIIKCLEEALVRKYGKSHVEDHMAMSSKGDTLCYATQVNQDALARALEQPVDVAIVVGGKNSSNTYQLYRLCESRFGDSAFYIQSERNILSASTIEHFIFPYDPKNPKQGVMVERPFLSEKRPVNVLLTGGASCPDGILQRIIARINGLFPSADIREVNEVIQDLS